MTNIDRDYFTSIINTDSDGRRFWIFVEVPESMFNSEITEEEIEALDPERCYLDSVQQWSKEAVDRLDILLSLPDAKALYDDDRKELELAMTLL